MEDIKSFQFTSTSSTTPVFYLDDIKLIGNH
jgi:hypothetical protein